LQAEVNDVAQGVLDKRWHVSNYQDQAARLYYVAAGTGSIAMNRENKNKSLRGR